MTNVMRECDCCGEVWEDDFFLEKRSVPLVIFDYEEGAGVAIEERYVHLSTCLNCCGIH